MQANTTDVLGAGALAYIAGPPAFLKWKEAVEHWRAAAEQDIRNKVVVGVSPSPTTPPWSRC
jgi:hypothetical protein